MENENQRGIPTKIITLGTQRTRVTGNKHVDVGILGNDLSTQKTPSQETLGEEIYALRAASGREGGDRPPPSMPARRLKIRSGAKRDGRTAYLRKDDSCTEYGHVV